MSKSVGNVISPLDIMKNSGADILRLWVASSSYEEDVRISEEILARLIDAYRKIRNTFRYLLGNLNGFDPDQEMVDYDQLLSIDRWALSSLAGRIKDVKTQYNEYQFAKVTKIIYTFCNEDLSSFYLDILKDRLYTSATNSGKRKSAQTVLYHIVNHLVRVLAPLLPFTAQEIFLAMPKDRATESVENVHLLSWLEVPLEWKNEEIRDRFKLLIKLRPHVLKALEDSRRDELIGSSLEAKVKFLTASRRDGEYLRQNKDFLAEAFIVSQVEVTETKEIKIGLGEEFTKTTITINPADGAKCDRCWKYKKDVGEDSDHPGLCRRCCEIVKEQVDATKET